MAKAPQFPFYVRDWICSRTVKKMSGNAVKAYVYMLAESWLSIPRATLPNDDEELSVICNLNIDAFLAIKSEIMQCFKIGTCKEHKGFLYNERLLEISRKYENNKRLNNKNAKRTRIKRERNTKQTRALDNDNDIDNDINSFKKERIVKERKRFVPPSLDQIQEYIKDKKLEVSAKSFLSFYESKNWMVGKNKMSNWKSALTGWHNRNLESKPKKANRTWHLSLEKKSD